MATPSALRWAYGCCASVAAFSVAASLTSPAATGRTIAEVGPVGDATAVANERCAWRWRWVEAKGGGRSRLALLLTSPSHPHEPVRMTAVTDAATTHVFATVTDAGGHAQMPATIGLEQGRAKVTITAEFPGAVCVPRSFIVGDGGPRQAG